MTKPKHTPGPWTHVGSTIRTPGDGSHRKIADLGDPRGQLPSMFEANARLIAAAPELVQFARMMETYFDNNLDGYGDFRQIVREILAKVDGGSHE